eukprot:gene7513-9234_t
MGKQFKRPNEISFASFTKSLFTPSWMDQLRLKITRMFGSDYRSMAAFRFVMACCVIGDVIERWTDMRVMYTESGVMPRHLILSRFSSNYFIPLHLANTTIYFQTFLFSFHIFVALMMAVGYRTKFFSFLTWFMTISLQAYNGIVGHGGDVFFRMMLFLCMFIPTAEVFSVDSASFSDSKFQTKSPRNDDFNISSSSKGNSNGGSYQIVNLSEPDSSPTQTIVDSNNGIDGETKIDIPIINNSNNSSSNYLKNKFLDPNRYRYLSFATAAILIQMGCMYVTSYFHKSGEEWKNGEATFYAISLDYFATDFAKFISSFRLTLKLLTIAVAKWELLGIFFLCSPFYTDWCRLIGAVGFAFMHLGFVLCLRLGLFFWVTAGAQVINIPSSAWDWFFDWAEKKLLKGQRPTRVYYNTTSPLSQYIALTLKTFFIIPSSAVFSHLDHIQFDEINMSNMSTAVSTSPIVGNNESDDEGKSGFKKLDISNNNSGRGLIGDDWLVTIDANGIRRRNISALHQICSKSPILFGIAFILNYVPQGIADVFGKIMNIIHSISKRKQAESNDPSLYQRKRHLKTQPHRIFSILNNIWMAFILWFILSYNCNTFGINLGYKPEYAQFAFVLRLDQGWNMFSPAPPKTHWWHVIHGYLEDGTQVELFKDEGLFKFEINTKVNFDKPDPFYPSYGNHRWFKYWENGFNSFGADPMRLELGRYICREFNSRHHGDKMLYKFNIYFVHEFMNLDGSTTAPQFQSLWNHVCRELREGEQPKPF